MGGGEEEVEEREGEVWRRSGHPMELLYSTQSSGKVIRCLSLTNNRVTRNQFSEIFFERNQTGGGTSEINTGSFIARRSSYRFGEINGGRDR